MGETKGRFGVYTWSDIVYACATYNEEFRKKILPKNIGWRMEKQSILEIHVGSILVAR